MNKEMNNIDIFNIYAWSRFRPAYAKILGDGAADDLFNQTFGHNGGYNIKNAVAQAVNARSGAKPHHKLVSFMCKC